MKYRIVIETELSGKKWYYVQKKILGYFWVYLSTIRGIDGHSYRISFLTLEQAQNHLQSEIDYRYEKEQQKIIKREYITN